MDIDLSEWKWLQDNPQFRERPATFDEFLGPSYLNNRASVRPGTYHVLSNLIGSEVNPRNPTTGYMGMMAGAIGIGKSYTSGILLAYVVHWTLCLKDPQEFFGLDKGSKIAFAIMSTTEKQARGVAFDNVKARIKFSPWFNDPAHPERLPNPKFKNIVEWTHRYITILPGTSEETSYEGYNILGAVIDEMDSHKITDRKDYGEEGFNTIYNRMNSRFDDRGFIFLIGQLKALRLMEPVLTPSGWVEMGDLQVGDEVIGSDGKPTKVIQVTEQGKVPLFRVTTTDGISVDCTGDHLWSVYNLHNKHYDKKCGRRPKLEVHSTKDLIDRGLRTLKNGGGQRKWQVPVLSGPIEFEPAKLPVEPYTLGALLGDGCTVAGSCSLTSDDPEIPERIQSELPRTGGMVNHYGGISYGISYPVQKNAKGQRVGGTNVLKEALNKLGASRGAHEKSIPVQYLRSSHSERLDLLRGLMDTDGTVNPRQNACRFTTVSPQLARDVVELVRSLGGIATQHKPFQGKYRGSDGNFVLCRDVYTVGVRLDECPFWLKRKAEDWCPRTTNPIVRSIDSIKEIEPDYAKCIAVDAEDGLFVTRDYLITHNSRSGFAQRKWEDLVRDGHFVYRCTIWDSRGWAYYADAKRGELFGVDEDGEPKHFYYDTQRYEVVPSQVIKWGQREADDQNLLKVPLVYKSQFETNGPKALKDLAGIPPLVGDPFIPDASKVLAARERWQQHNIGFSPPMERDGRVSLDFKARNKIKRVMHIDMGLSGNGDALGMAMGHVSGVREVDGEMKAVIEFDLLRQFTVKPGFHIELAQVRHFIYTLVNDLGFRLALVTFDGFENTDFSQQLKRRRIQTDVLSVDRTYAPYHDFREAIYEDRVSWPLYEVRSRSDSGDYIELAFSEATQLIDDGKKVDHTLTSTKDLTDAMAGVVHTLMVNPTLHRRGGHAPSTGQRLVGSQGSYDRFAHPAYIGDRGVRAPGPLSAQNGNRHYG